MRTTQNHRSTRVTEQNQDYLAGGETAIGFVWLAFYGLALVGALVSPILAQSIAITALY